MNVEIANRLVQLRKQSNLSQEELAMRLGISRQAVSKWERAESSPDTDNLIALASLYRLSLDDLVHSDLPPEPTAYVPPYQSEAAEAALVDSSEDEPVEDAVKPEDALPEGSFYDTKQGKKHMEGFLQKAPYPVLITFIYLVIGFLFNLWHPGWLLFLTIPLHYMPDRGKSPLGLLANPVMITLIYLILGIFFHLWHPGWLIFLAIPLLQAYAK